MSEIRVEQLVGRKVFDRDGRSVGRIEEICAEKKWSHHVVTEVHLGPAALLERLSAGTAVFSPGAVRRKGYIASWDQIDFADLRHLTLRCPIEELKKIAPV